MNLISQGILCVCLIGLANSLTISELFVQNCNKTVDFQCDPTDPTAITIFNQTARCPVGQICNVILDDDCSPCINKSTTCHDRFTCNPADPSEVTVKGDIKLRCKQNYQCNKNFTEPCNLCVMVPCATDNIFTCHANNEALVTVGNIELVCKTGFVCNKDRLQPCTPCISKEDLIVTPEPDPPTIEGEPDCNDGYGGSNPCRPSSVSSGLEKFYYRCRSVWWWYEVELVSCANQPSDKKCRNDTAICK